MPSFRKSSSLFLLIFLAACSQPTEPSERSRLDSPASVGGIQPMCQLGCLDEDPNPEPNSIGIYLGSGVTEDLCFGGGQTDNDADGLSTFCERALAQAFAPQLYYAHNDNVGREPRWAAMPINGTQVRIAYLLAYYVDNGPLLSCGILHEPVTLIWGDDACDGHWGDSEAITLDVQFDPALEHWVLQRAQLSTHHEYRIFSARHGYPSLYYPEHPGGYPRIWIAFSKHANYESDSACDSGGTLNSDECLSDTFARVEAGGNLDIGSRASHTSSQDCVGSANPVYAGNGVTECFWTDRRFTGWSGASPNAGSYVDRLANLGF